MKRTNIQGTAFRRELAAAHRARRLADEETVAIYQIKKNGDRYARPHVDFRGHSRFTRAEAEIERLVGDNPGQRFEIV